MSSNLYLYGTSYCHLCEQAYAIVSDACSDNHVTVRSVDISDDDALMHRFGLRIPVLACGLTGVELDWPFDQDDVLALVRSIQPENRTCE